MLNLRSIKFDDMDTRRDWNLILNSLTIDPSKAKTNFVEVPGRDGDIDITENLDGEVHYKNRSVQFHFLMMEGTHPERVELMRIITNYLHGRSRRIILPDDDTRYMVGRCTLSGILKNQSYMEFDVSANCEPWKYSTEEAVRTLPATATKKEHAVINLGRKTIVPDVTVSGSVSLEFGAYKTTLSEGSYKILDIKLKSGSNIFTISGNGSITFTYREAVL